MILKPINCPKCGKLLCRAKIGSELEIYCRHCKTEVKGIIDLDGGVHALPISKLVKKVQV